jgi:ethanolamine utilization protein EutA
MIFSELVVENRAGAFSVPELEIGERRILYRSPVYMTPLLRGELVDTAALRRIVDEAYTRAGVEKGSVDTGAIIITGETSRKENARAVLAELSGYAGDFVVAAAGPDLERVLSAKGAGALALSRQMGKPVLHMDIGGGTSNLTLAENGKIKATGCLNVGGRLLKFDEAGKITYVSPVLRGLCPLQVGDIPSAQAVRQVAVALVQALEMAAGLREPTDLLEKLWTKEAKNREILALCRGQEILSFSGGVADCIEKTHPPLAFGDMGPALGKAIRESRLCRGEYRLGGETIRATVIGAGCHSAQLSGSTVFHRNVTFPLKNLPVFSLDVPQADAIRAALKALDGPAVMTLAHMGQGGYGMLTACADAIVKGFGDRPVLVCLEQDAAKALGQAIALRLPADRSVLCIDRIKLTPESYLDVAAPVGPALPVVIKTLILEQ